MSTLKDFKNAPGGAIATSPYGGRAMKVYDGERHWITSRGIHLNDKEMVQLGYTLDPLEPAPTTAHEALDLAWELAHEVEKGQSIPSGTQYLLRHGPGYLLEVAHGARRIDSIDAENIRTLDPCLDPVPDWYDAPAVLASDKRDDTGDYHTWINVGGGEWFTTRRLTTHWSTLRHVTPLYPKGQEA